MEDVKLFRGGFLFRGQQATSAPTLTAIRKGTRAVFVCRVMQGRAAAPGNRARVIGTKGFSGTNGPHSGLDVPPSASVAVGHEGGAYTHWPVTSP